MYYHALLANNMLAPGEDYQNLKETYVIFLCGFDPFGLGWAVTDYQMTAQPWESHFGRWNSYAYFKC